MYPAQRPAPLAPIAPIAPRAFVPREPDSNMLYDSNYDDPDELSTSEQVTQTVIDSGVVDTRDATRREYLSLMGGNPTSFTTRFSTTGTATRDLLESRLGAEDATTAVTIVVGETETETEIVIPGNRAHLFCFLNDFGKSDNRLPLDSFYGVISGAMGTIPSSQHYLSAPNDGKRSRATALLLVINEGNRLAFMVIRGWQIIPHIIMRGDGVSIPVEYWSTSMLNYSLPITGEGVRTVTLNSKDHVLNLLTTMTIHPPVGTAPIAVPTAEDDEAESDVDDTASDI